MITTTPDPAPMNNPPGDAEFVIADLAARWVAADRGDTPAVIVDDVHTSYRELDDAANRVANGLAGLGLGGGDRVAYIGRNDLPVVEVLLGVAKAGVVSAVLNWRLHPQELTQILADSDAQVVIVTHEFAGALRVGGQTRVITVTDDDDAPGGYRRWLADQSPEPPVPVRFPDDVAVQLYTSGTTGVPKGAMLTNAGLRATIPDTAQLWELDPTSVVLSVLPMFHIAGIGTVLGALWAGSAVVIDNDARPEASLASISRHRVTNLVLASVMLQNLVTCPARAGSDLSSLRTVSYGAAPITEQVLADAIAAFGCRLMQPYGLTETTGILTVLDADDHAFAPGDIVGAARLRSCGRPRPGVELRIIDPSSGRDQPIDVPGEVWARTPRMMKGYWRQPEATKQVLLPDGWFRSGDIGDVDEDGYLYLRDRLKDVIVSGGENVYPTEVENALQSHPAVAHVAVIGIPDDKWGETPRAIVIAEPGATVTGDELIAFARSRLAHYKCPTSVELVDELPRNPTGKVLKRELREPYWAGYERRVN